MAHVHQAGIEWTADARELVGPGRGGLGARRSGHQPRRRPLPGARGTTSGSGLAADVRARGHRAEGADAAVEHLCRRGGAHARLPRRGAARGPERALYQMEDYIQQVLAFDVRRGRAGPRREDGGVLHLARPRDQRDRSAAPGSRRPTIPRSQEALERDTPAPGTSCGGRATCACPPRAGRSAHCGLHISHILQVCSRHTADLDAGVPARGLNGEAYRGHVFWDELYVYPFLNFRLPGDHAGAAHVPLSGASARRGRRRARLGSGVRCSPGRAGATARRKPRPSISTRCRAGGNRTSAITSDTSTRRSSTTSGSYYQATEDSTFLRDYGAEMMLEIARFWASIAHYNPERDRYEIHGVMGPDEFHEKYPGRDRGRLAQQRLHERDGRVDAARRPARCWRCYPRAVGRRCAARIGLTDEEIAHLEAR